jgi:DNA-directed RNA polymerase subunit L
MEVDQTIFSVILRGHAIGIANAMSQHISEQECTDFVCFKAPHPLRDDSKVILSVPNIAAAEAIAVQSCHALTEKIQHILQQLPSFEKNEENVYNAISADLTIRQINHED